MRKEEIYVVIDSEEKRLRALDIFERAGEKVWEDSCLLTNKADGSPITWNKNGWAYGMDGHETEITLDQLEQLLIPMSQLEQLKQQAEALGYELVEKKREIKVGDFGVFWDIIDNDIFLGTLKCVSDEGYIPLDGYFAGNVWQNFRHLTEEEKQHIQNNW